MSEHEEARNEEKAMATRRAVLQAAIGTAALSALLSSLYVGAGLIPRTTKTPENEPPQVGDILVYATGPKMNQPIQLADLPEGGPFQLAFPMDPKAKVIRNKEPKNTLLVLRQAAGGYDPKVAAHVAQGVVCYSAICTHLGCTVSLWDASQKLMRCPCHGALYDPRQAKVVGGPAPQALAQLPIRLEGGQIVVAGEFLGPVGAQV